MINRHRPHLVIDILFFGFLAGYTAYAIAILAFGVLAAIAHTSPDLHQNLHLIGFDAQSFVERLAQAIATASHQAESGGNLAIDYGFSLLNVVLGLYLVYLRPHNRTARFLAVGMVGTAAIFNLQAISVYSALQASNVDNAVHFGFELIAMLAYLYALLTFPDAQLVPRWPAWAQAVLYVPITLALSLTLNNLQSAPLSRLAIVGVFGLVIPAVGLLAQAYRWILPKNAEERQLSRLLFMALLPVVVMVQFVHAEQLQALINPSFPGRALAEVPVGFFRVFQPVFAIIPVALFIGIVRYRLWDIDRIISRTLVYGALGGFVSAVYIGLVVGVGNLIGTQQHNLFLSLLATGLVALLFQPVRNRVQGLANRLVYGNRSTPYQVLSSFSHMVESYGAEDVLSRTVRILSEGTGASAMVWLKVEDEFRASARWPQTATLPALGVPLDGDQLPRFPNADLAVPVRHQGELLGAFTIRKRGEALTAAETKLISDLAAQAGLVVRNSQLTADLLARLDDLRQSRQRLVRAQDEARRRLERNIHDGAQQQLVALKVQLSLAERLVDRDPAKLKLALAQLKQDTDEAVQSLRELARGIYPPLLAESGLATALQAQVRKSAVPITIDAETIGRYLPETESAVYFCCLEALQNVAKSADASSATVRLSASDGVLAFAVDDDGKGFDPTHARDGSGLQNMTDRIEALGGKLTIRSAPGKGTRISGTVPAQPRVVDDRPAPNPDRGQPAPARAPQATPR
ncbi:MAG: sensor histidine kinase [Candidatus Dormibacteraeota bacterium]|nr:sensor histidine kinase [Candidatus Dormibacteraeota bacterium]